MSIMRTEKNVIAIILARGGSKGIPNKNIIDFCGKPLIAWSIEQATNTKGINSVWVSSDDKKILDISAEYGANLVIRPKEFATDTASSESAWLHAIEYIENAGNKIDLVIGMQPTSPLREPKDIEHALEEFEKMGYDSMFSGAILKDFFIWLKNEDGKLDSFNYDYKNRKRRQDVNEQFVENGSFYIFKPEIIKAQNNRLAGNIGIAKMELWKTFEIDSMEDMELCETLMKYYLLDS